MTDRPRPTPEQLARYASKFNESQTMRLISLKLSFPSADLVCIDIDPLRAEHRGGFGSDAVNGGVIAAVFDVAIGCCAALVDPLKRSATMQLSMQFERPLRGERLHAEARITSAGEKTLYASATAANDAGEICARASGLVRLTQVPWAGGDNPAVN